MVELFLREAIIMKDFRHPNVLHILGVTFDCDNSPMVVLPFMANGDLRQYILNPSLVCTTLSHFVSDLQFPSSLGHDSALDFGSGHPRSRPGRDNCV
jgi:serine/threonine protein kinase